MAKSKRKKTATTANSVWKNPDRARQVAELRRSNAAGVHKTAQPRSEQKRRAIQDGFS